MRIGTNLALGRQKAPAVGGWNPLSLVSTREWFQISNTNTITGYSIGAPSAVNGRAGLLSLAQATPAYQPTINGSVGANAIHALTFGGVGVYMKAVDSLAQPFTLASICQTTDASSLQVLMDFDGATADKRFGIQAANTWRCELGLNANGTTTTDTAAHVVLLEANGASTKIYIDGVLIGTGNCGAGSVTAWQLGLRGNGFNPWYGPISDTVISNGILSASDRASLVSFLGNLAGIAVS